MCVVSKGSLLSYTRLAQYLRALARLNSGTVCGCKSGYVSPLQLHRIPDADGTRGRVPLAYGWCAGNGCARYLSRIVSLCKYLIVHNLMLLVLCSDGAYTGMTSGGYGMGMQPHVQYPQMPMPDLSVRGLFRFHYAALSVPLIVNALSAGVEGNKPLRSRG